MLITDRISLLKRQVQIQTGGTPVGLLLGEEQMVELQLHLEKMGMPRGHIAAEYDGMLISMQPGVDGVVIVHEQTEMRPVGRSAIRDLMQRVRTRYIGAYPITF